MRTATKRKTSLTLDSAALEARSRLISTNPETHHNSRRLILATRLIAAVRRARLTRRGRVADQGNLITRAVGVLMAGV